MQPEARAASTNTSNIGWLIEPELFVRHVYKGL